MKQWGWVCEASQPAGPFGDRGWDGWGIWFGVYASGGGVRVRPAPCTPTDHPPTNDVKRKRAQSQLIPQDAAPNTYIQLIPYSRIIPFLSTPRFCHLQGEAAAGAGAGPGEGIQ